MRKKPRVLEVVKPADEPFVIWFQLNEVDARLLAKGMVGRDVQRQAAAAVAWLEDDPVGYLDQDFLKLAQ